MDEAALPQDAATSVLLAASPLLEGVTGRYVDDNQKVEVVAGGPEATGGVAANAVPVPVTPAAKRSAGR
ncbi:hypothetical protein [Micromonospora sp. CNB394]|uniref:hypothetical protein n=1 Tax=Micromonospora sp. CNB394 TaxID=1169151 RepID=UPI00035EBD9A|nr:hypothetical protein [Micromonospora sp. CNB394]